MRILYGDNIQQMNNLAEIQGWFVPRVVPCGSAPEYIKEQWIDVPLPIRNLGKEETPSVQIGHKIGNTLSIEIVENPVEILAFDALKSLQIFKKPDAREFWLEMIAQKMISINQPLLFRAREGVIYSTPTIQKILPGIERFDEV